MLRFVWVLYQFERGISENSKFVAFHYQLYISGPEIMSQTKKIGKGGERGREGKRRNRQTKERGEGRGRGDKEGIEYPRFRNFF